MTPDSHALRNFIDELRRRHIVGHLDLDTATRNILQLSLILTVSLTFFVLIAYRLDKTPDLHNDEMVYYAAAFNIANRGEFTWDQDPIFVHPPVQFLLQAMMLNLLGLADKFEPFTGTYSARLLNAITAAVTVGILFRLMERLHGLRAAIMGSAFLIFDPFVLRICRRNYLETVAEFWVVLGLYLFWREHERLDARRVLLLGTIFGIGLLAKELMMFGFLSIPLFMVLSGRWRNLPAAIAIGAISLCIWTIFPIWSWQVGQWDVFLDNKTYNLRRLLGLVQVTGWNRPGVSFVGALMVNLVQYATSYILVLLGALILLVVLMTWREPAGRFVCAWVGAKYAFFAYSIAGGALNDQFFYYLLVPLAPLYGTTLARWFDLLTRSPRSLDAFNSLDAGVIALDSFEGLRSVRLWIPGWLITALQFVDGWLRVVANGLIRFGFWISRWRVLSYSLLLITVVGCVAVLGFNGYRWVTLFAIQEDNSLYKLTQYVNENIPPRTEINSMFEARERTLRFMMENHQLVTLRDPAKIEDQGIKYAILSSKNLWGRYGGFTPDYYEWVENHGTQIFHTYGNTYWDLSLYELDFGRDAAADGPVEGGGRGIMQ